MCLAGCWRVCAAASRQQTVPGVLMHSRPAGALAGVFSSTMTYPLDFVRARLTVQDGSIEMRYTGVMDAFKKARARQQGALPRSALTPCMRRLRKKRAFGPCTEGWRHRCWCARAGGQLRL